MLDFLVVLTLSSFVLSIGLTAGYLFVLKREFGSKSYKFLNDNLGKIEMFWSSSQANFKLLSEGDLASDEKSLLRSAAIMGFVLSFLSGPGFVLLFIIILSTRVLARSRLEKSVFKSELTKADLESVQVAALVSELKLVR